MSTIKIGEVETFANVKPDKAQALKPLEEAAEVFGAWQVWDCTDDSGPSLLGSVTKKLYGKQLLDECADVIQATCNLLAALGVEDFAPYMAACAERNRERGRM